MGEADDRDEGKGILDLTLFGTAALLVTSLSAAAFPDAFGVLHAGLSCVLFAVGTGGLLWGYALGVARSRTDDVSLGGLFFLSAPAAPVRVRRRFRTALTIETVVVVVAAAIRPFGVVAFGVLAPMFALGLMGVWGGRHAVFPPRPTKAPA